MSSRFLQIEEGLSGGDSRLNSRAFPKRRKCDVQQDHVEVLDLLHIGAFDHNTLVRGLRKFAALISGKTECHRASGDSSFHCPNYIGRIAAATDANDKIA